jgi:hypothetical protein
MNQTLKLYNVEGDPIALASPQLSLLLSSLLDL